MAAFIVNMPNRRRRLDARSTGLDRDWDAQAIELQRQAIEATGLTPTELAARLAAAGRGPIEPEDVTSWATATLMTVDILVICSALASAAGQAIAL